MTKQIVCKEAGFHDCEFMVQSEDEREVVKMALEHAKNAHAADISRSDAEGLVKTV